MSLNNCLFIAEIENEGKGCWDECKQNQGKCSWCGSMGYCCRKDYFDLSKGCDGTFGGDADNHVCVKPPGNYSMYSYMFSFMFWKRLSNQYVNNYSFLFSL